jgi:hypothetical protein
VTRKNLLASRPSYFKKTDDGVPELSQHHDVETDRNQNIQTSRRTKRTYYLPDDVVEILDELQYEERKRTGEKPELSELVAQGIRLLATSRNTAS